MGKSSGGVRSNGRKKEPKIDYSEYVNVKDIFNDIGGINTNTNSISSLGTYVSDMSIRISENKIREIKEYINKDSLAYKILDSDSNFNLSRGFSFTEKQKWAIAYELQKNKNYVNKLGKQLKNERLKSERKALESKNKKATNKADAQPNLDLIKQNGKKLGDYYKWLNNRNNIYRKEYFNKKYSLSSVMEFINLK